jgi:hypothetical protein
MFYGILKENKQIWGSKNRETIIKSVITRPEYSAEDIQEFTDDKIELAYNGFYYLKNHAPQPSREYISEQREKAYEKEVDPITCHINRLKDEEPTEEIEAEIASLIEERKAIVANIKERYPYPEEVQNG